MNTLTPNFVSRRPQLALEGTTRTLSKTYQRLSSGLRINSAADDAAGLSISTRMQSQIEGLNQSARNANDGVSLLQTAEGALSEMGNMLQRARELVVQAGNETLSSNDREAIQAELDQIKDEINRTSTTSNFNGVKLFSGEAVSKTLQIGANVGETANVSLTKVDSSTLGRQARYEASAGVDGSRSLLGGVDSLTINGFAIRDTVDGDDTVSKYNSGFQGQPNYNGSTSAIAKAKAINASSEFTGVRAIVGETRTDASDDLNAVLGGVYLGTSGSVQQVTLTANTYMEINGVKITGFEVQANDSDGALVTAINSAYDQTGVIAELNADSELVLIAKDGRNIQVSYADDGIIGTDEGQGLETLIGLRSGTDYAGGLLSGQFVYGGKITLQSDSTFEFDFTGSVNSSLGVISQSGQPGVFGTNEKNSFDTIDVLDIRSVDPALDTIDLAIDQVSSKRAELGAMQNRLESTINNLNQNAENLSAASSRIKDADFATETATLASHQIKQQAAVSILSQMSASGQLLLNLLR